MTHSLPPKPSGYAIRTAPDHDASDLPRSRTYLMEFTFPVELHPYEAAEIMAGLAEHYGWEDGNMFQIQNREEYLAMKRLIGDRVVPFDFDDRDFVEWKRGGEA